MKSTLDFHPKFLASLASYSKEKFTKDLMAGIIVGIVALPLAIAFGIASGVSPEKGLITAIIGGFIVSFLGGNSVQIGGPTGAFIVIVYGIIQAYGLEGLAIATFMAGLILVLMGCFRLGTIIKFIPYPIVVGFTSGIALTIFATQIKDLLGLSMDSVPADFISKWVAYFQQFLVAGHRNTQYSHHCLHSPHLQQNTGLPHGDYSHDRAGLCARTCLGNRRNRDHWRPF